MPKKINWEPFQELYDMGLTDSEIASELDAEPTSVKRHRKSLGLPSNWSNAEVRRAYCSTKKEKRHRKVPAKSLVEVAREARERGMSYGQYMVAQRKET